MRHQKASFLNFALKGFSLTVIAIAVIICMMVAAAEIAFQPYKPALPGVFVDHGAAVK